MSLQIIFQSGEFYNQDSWLLDVSSAAVGAFISSLTTVLVLYYTIRHDKRKEQQRLENKEKELIAHRKRIQFEKIQYLKILVKNISNGLNQQTDLLQTFSESIVQNPGKLSKLPKVPITDLAVIVHRLNQEEYYLAYIGEFGIGDDVSNEFRRLMNLVSYFFELTASLHDTAEKMESDFRIREMALKHAIEEVMDDAAMICKIHSQEVAPEAIKAINELLSSFYKNRPEVADTQYHMTEFVAKLKERIVSHMDDSPIIARLMLQLKRISVLQSDMHESNKHLASDMSSQRERLLENLRVFSELSLRLQAIN